MEQRRFPRYQLATPLAGTVEQDGERFSGSILNISAVGFYLHLAKKPESGLAIQGGNDYGEIRYAGRNANGFGSLVRVEKFSTGVGVGFSWDKNGLDEASSLLLSEVNKEQESKRLLGRVTTSASDILLAGHVSSALSEEVFSSLRAIGAGKSRVSLRKCISIDSSGIALLMALRDRGLPIVEVAPDMEAVIQRFQLSGTNPGQKNSDAG